uniref:Uncharacterized protein n=1 Tax=Manihot esculenta TaxID=3983 RepID=A0A2C9UVE0_MANES
MAALHVRSISFPSRSHPLYVSIEEHLYELKASQSSSIGHKLAALKELYVDDFLQLSFTQQTFCHEGQNQTVEEALNGSLGLLDMRECVQGLESSIRRKRVGESGFNEVDVYMVSKKRSIKVIGKYLRNFCRTTTLDENFDLVNMINLLKCAEEISLAGRTKLSGWFVVSKLWQPKNGEVEANEVENIDDALLVLKSSKGINQELDCVYRRLVKTRVTLINILNN